MTTSPADPPQDALRVMSVGTGGEREVLEAFLDFQRAVLVRKVTAVSEQDARRRLVPSMTTLAALINHLTSVELKWFGHHLGQRPLRDLGLEDGEEASWRVGPQENVDGLIARYEQVCGLSRQTAAHFTLDDVVPHPQLDRVSLRWIYVHMIEETARHTGHADILREQIDGVTGVTG